MLYRLCVKYKYIYFIIFEKVETSTVHRICGACVCLCAQFATMFCTPNDPKTSTIISNRHWKLRIIWLKKSPTHTRTLPLFTSRTATHTHKVIFNDIKYIPKISVSSVSSHSISRICQIYCVVVVVFVVVVCCKIVCATRTWRTSDPAAPNKLNEQERHKCPEKTSEFPLI